MDTENPTGSELSPELQAAIDGIIAQAKTLEATLDQHIATIRAERAAS